MQFEHSDWPMVYRAAWKMLVVGLVGIVSVNSASTRGASPAQETAFHFEKLPGADGQTHSLSDYRDAEALVIAITCNHCPIAIEYAERMNRFVEQQNHAHPGKVAVIAVSISDLESDSLPRMKEFSEKHGLKYAYLYDASQFTAQSLDAEYTPQFFVLDPRRHVVYRGAWDDELNPQKVSRRYVTDAVEAVLKKELPATRTAKGRGCIVTYRKGLDVSIQRVVDALERP